MREIKFRSWDEKRKLYLSWPELCAYSSEMLYYILIGNYGTLSIEQYTELKDKNGKEIYEGDICKRKYYKNEKESHEVAEIVFWEGAFIFRKYCIHDYALTNFSCCRTFEVIGNIHEDLELLKTT